MMFTHIYYTRNFKFWTIFSVLSHKKVNLLKLSNFWGSLQNNRVLFILLVYLVKYINIRINKNKRYLDKKLIKFKMLNIKINKIKDI